MLDRKLDSMHPHEMGLEYLGAAAKNYGCSTTIKVERGGIRTLQIRFLLLWIESTAAEAGAEEVFYMQYSRPHKGQQVAIKPSAARPESPAAHAFQLFFSTAKNWAIRYLLEPITKYLDSIAAEEKVEETFVRHVVMSTCLE